MGNKTFFFKIFFLSVLLAGSVFSADFTAIKKDLSSNSGEQSLRAYNALKSLYINAIMDDDAKTKEESLKLLEQYAKEFGDDPQTYKDELKTLGVRTYAPKPPKSASVSPPKAPNVVKKPTVQKVALNSAKTTPKKETAKNTTTGPPVITSAKVAGNTLTLQFNQKIDDTAVLKNFTIKGSPLKYVYDLKASLFAKMPKGSLSGIDKTIVAQNKPGVVRVVLYSDTKKDLAIAIDQDKIIITNKSDENVIDKLAAQAKSAPVQKQEPKKSYLNLKNKVIVIDPGHGGKDCGAMAIDKKTCEKTLVLKIAQYVRKDLLKRGFKRVYLTRSKDVFIKLRNRTGFANDKNADIFVSIHLNSIPKSANHALAKGTETYFLSHARSDRAKRVAALENKEDIEDMDYFTKNTLLSILNSKRIVESNKLAIDIQRGMIKNGYTLKDGGVREGPFWVLVGAQMPSVLVEAGYISNRSELNMLKKTSYQQKTAEGIAEGIINYLKNNG